MTYKDALFFIGKCLTINHEKHNKIIVENNLKSGNIDWEAVVKASTGHFVFPALYCNLKKAEFLHYLPSDLVNYMNHISSLNRERNQEIIEQAKDINQLLLKNNITPIFLKGTGNLLEGLYDDIAERMVGDIDFIVSKNDYKKTIHILESDGYKSNKKYWNSFHWHYPAMVKKKCIGAIEIHNKVLKKPYTNILNFDEISKNSIEFKSIMVASFNNQILNAVLPKQINDNLYHTKVIPLRTVYDIFLMSKKQRNGAPKTNIKKVNNRFNNFLACAELLLNYNTKLGETENKYSRSYLKGFILKLENSKKEKIKESFFAHYMRIRDRFKILQYSFTDKEYRHYSLKKLSQIEFYLKILNLKKIKPNP